MLAHIKPSPETWSFLPFLYRTKTISRPYLRSQKNLHTSCTNRTQRIPESYGSHQAIGDEYSTFNHPSSAPRSTLTLSERAAFERLEGVSKRHKVKNPSEDDLPIRDVAVLDGADEDLSRLFDKALQDQQLQRHKERSTSERATTKPEVRTYWRAMNTFGLEDRELFTKDEELYKLGVIRPLEYGEYDSSQHNAQVRKKITSATTDAGIWRILELNVFNLVQDVVKQVDEYPTLHQTWKVSERRRADRRKRMEEEEPAAADDGVSAASPRYVADDVFGESRVVKLTNPLDVLIRNYAALNAEALHQLRRYYPGSPYSLRLLPHIKSLGKISYVLGASPTLYNETFFARWEQHRDLHGVLDLLKEMIDQGLKPNLLTFRFLRHLDKIRTKDLRGDRGQIIQAWWHVRSNEEAWTSLHQLYFQLQSELEREPLPSDLGAND